MLRGFGRAIAVIIDAGQGNGAPAGINGLFAAPAKRCQVWISSSNVTASFDEIVVVRRVGVLWAIVQCSRH